MYKPVRRGNPVLSPCTRRKDSTNAHVLPFPFVPATCTMFSPLTSESYACNQRQLLNDAGDVWPHRMTKLLKPLSHPNDVRYSYHAGLPMRIWHPSQVILDIRCAVPIPSGSSLSTSAFKDLDGILLLNQNKYGLCFESSTYFVASLHFHGTFEKETLVHSETPG